MSNRDVVYGQVVDGLRLQAAPFAVQQRAVPAFTNVPDEVLNAVFTGYFPQLLARGLARESSGVALQRYAEFLDSHKPASSHEAALADLEHGPWFAELRVRARELLVALGEEYRAPMLDGTTYVQGA